MLRLREHSENLPQFFHPALDFAQLHPSIDLLCFLFSGQLKKNHCKKSFIYFYYSFLNSFCTIMCKLLFSLWIHWILFIPAIVCRWHCLSTISIQSFHWSTLHLDRRYHSSIKCVMESHSKIVKNEGVLCSYSSSSYYSSFCLLGTSPIPPQQWIKTPCSLNILISHSVLGNLC